MSWLALDIGGANLKAADGQGFAISRAFPLWKTPQELTEALRALIAESPPADRLAITMTGELADCFETKSDGVRFILDRVELAADGRATLVYLLDGRLASVETAKEQPLLAAAANWHALAHFVGRFAPTGAALLIDVGSTTCDIIPLRDGRPIALGSNDTDRLLHRELVYTGVDRSPVCAIASALDYRGQDCPTAQEFFATARDAYLILGELPEQPDDCHTADARPATKSFARDRLARMICADRGTFNESDSLAAARDIDRRQCQALLAALLAVARRFSSPPSAVILSGQGEFLARRAQSLLCWTAGVVSLREVLGEVVSRCAPAHALAVLARESNLKT